MKQRINQMCGRAPSVGSFSNNPPPPRHPTVASTGAFGNNGAEHAFAGIRQSTQPRYQPSRHFGRSLINATPQSRFNIYARKPSPPPHHSAGPTPSGRFASSNAYVPEPAAAVASSATVAAAASSSGYHRPHFGAQPSPAQPNYYYSTGQAAAGAPSGFHSYVPSTATPHVDNSQTRVALNARGVEVDAQLAAFQISEPDENPAARQGLTPQWRFGADNSQTRYYVDSRGLEVELDPVPAPRVNPYRPAPPEVEVQDDERKPAARQDFTPSQPSTQMQHLLEPGTPTDVKQEGTVDDLPPIDEKEKKQSSAHIFDGLPHRKGNSTKGKGDHYNCSCKNRHGCERVMYIKDGVVSSNGKPHKDECYVSAGLRDPAAAVSRAPGVPPDVTLDAYSICDSFAETLPATLAAKDVAKLVQETLKDKYGPYWRGPKIGYLTSRVRRVRQNVSGRDVLSALERDYMDVAEGGCEANLRFILKFHEMDRSKKKTYGRKQVIVGFSDPELMSYMKLRDVSTLSFVLLLFFSAFEELVSNSILFSLSRLRCRLTVHLAVRHALFIRR